MTTWIFQGNPRRFPTINNYLRTHKQIWWCIRQEHFIDKIKIGDDVYIWRSNGGDPLSGGIVAKGEITSLPQEIEDDVPDLWTGGQENRHRVNIDINDTRLNEEEGMVRRIDLIKDDGINGMRILRFPIETNHQLEPRHINYINGLWERKRKNQFKRH